MFTRLKRFKRSKRCNRRKRTKRSNRAGRSKRFRRGKMCGWFRRSTEALQGFRCPRGFTRFTRLRQFKRCMGLKRFSESNRVEYVLAV